MGKIEVRLVEGGEEMEAVMSLRIRVFVQEQGGPLEEEPDEYDATALHAVALVDGWIVGTGRLFRARWGEARIGRMAVEPGMRRRGVGGRILTFLQEKATEQGMKGITLHAQTYVKDFYRRHGYVEEGGVFLEDGIEHIKMSKVF